jgi:hypothetical protein
MAYKVKKTEHTGAKRGEGGLWGTKFEAKSGSRKIRRQNARRLIREELAMARSDSE